MRVFIQAAALCLWVLAAGPAARAADPIVVAGDLHDPREMVFVGNTLYFTDYDTSEVKRLAGGQAQTIWHERGCGASGLLQVPDGLLVACFDAGSIVKLSLDGVRLKTFSRDEKTNPVIAPNDLVADRSGGVYFTTSSAEGWIRGKIGYLDADGIIRTVATGIDFANGVVVSPDGKRLYVAETRRGRLLTFPIVDDGKLGTPHALVTLVDILADSQTAYSPDGLQIDDRGNLFVGLFNGGGIAVLRASGRLIRQINMPSPHHANLAVSPDGKWIYVTSVEDEPDGSHRGQIVRVANPATE